MVKSRTTTPKSASAIDRVDIGQRQGVEPGRALGEPAKAERPQRDAGQQEAEHRADAQAEEQRRDDAGGRQKEQRLLVDARIEGRVHRFGSPERA